MEEAEGSSGFKYCDNLGDLMEMTAVTRLYPPVPVKKWYIADSDLTVQAVLEVHATFLFPNPPLAHVVCTLGHKVLELYHISSLPVRNVSTGKCAGFIDSLDILGYRTTHHTTPSHVPGANNNMNLGRYLISVCTPSVEAGATLTDLDKAFEKFSTKGISELCGTSSARRLARFVWTGSVSLLGRRCRL